MKQRLLSLLLGLITCQFLMAHDFVSNGIYYKITDSYYKKVGVTFRGNSYSEYSDEYSGSVTIPSSVTYNGTTYSVASIQQDAFRDCTGLTYISIPESVTDVYLPFTGCTSLATIYLADGSNGSTTNFYSNTYSIYYDEYYEKRYKITEIPMFRDCPIQNFYIGHKIKAYYYFETIDFYDGGADYVVETAAGGLLKSNQTINRVEIGNSLNVGVPSIFPENSINNLYIPSIEKWCQIYQCEDESHYDDEGDWCVKFTGPTSNIMSSCVNLYVNNVKTTAIEIPTSVTTLGYAAFMNAKCIESVTLPPYLSSIGKNCFSGCTNLKRVINNSAFKLIKGSTSYGYVACYADVVINADDIDIDGYLFENTNGSYSLKAYIGNEKELTLPQSVNGNPYVIGAKAFQGMTDLTSVIIPNNSATAIGERAFSGCSGITSISIPESVTTIGGYAFYDCSGLTALNIPASLTSIGGYAFSGCSGLTTLNIPATLTSVGSYAFSRCTGLTMVNIPNTFTSIPQGMFETCSGLTSLAIPTSVMSIGASAFGGCTRLSSLTIPTSVTSIGYNAFQQCTGLTSVSIPGSVTSIGSGAFVGCSNLTEVYGSTLEQWCNINFGDNTANPTYYAHKLCLNGTEVTKLDIPSTITNIRANAFIGLSDLTEVNLTNAIYYCPLNHRKPLPTC